MTKFCASWVTIRVMESGITQFIQAWNSHRIPGPQGGIPSVLSQQRNIVTLSSAVVPSTAEIISLHESDGQHPLSRNVVYGFDPVFTHQALCEEISLLNFQI